MGICVSWTIAAQPNLAPCFGFVFFHCQPLHVVNGIRSIAFEWLNVVDFPAGARASMLAGARAWRFPLKGLFDGSGSGNAGIGCCDK